jgi:hypothetical protein
MLLDLQAARPATRADRLLGLQHDGHDHRPLSELHVSDPCSRKPEHPVECGGDPHVAPARLSLTFAQTSRLPQKGGGGSLGTCAARETSPTSTTNGVRSRALPRQAAAARSATGFGEPQRLQPVRPLDPGASAPLSGNERQQGWHYAHGSAIRHRDSGFTPKSRGVPLLRRCRARGGALGAVGGGYLGDRVLGQRGDRQARIHARVGG